MQLERIHTGDTFERDVGLDAEETETIPYLPNPRRYPATPQLIPSAKREARSRSPGTSSPLDAKTSTVVICLSVRRRIARCILPSGGAVEYGRPT